MPEYENNRSSHESSSKDDKLTTGQKIADAVAKFGGSWTFLITFSSFMLIWIVINSLSWFSVIHWDKYPFILLNLFLSFIAAFQAPIIMMSQNRKEDLTYSLD